MSDWWARQLGGNPQPHAPSTPPVTPPFRGAIRIPQPVQQPQQQPQQYQPQQEQTDTPTNMGEAIRVWKGGEAHRRDPYSCPECGSDHYFSRAKNGINGMAPAPVCYTCGYNGKYIQGEESSWVS